MNCELLWTVMFCELLETCVTIFCTLHTNNWFIWKINTLTYILKTTLTDLDFQWRWYEVARMLLMQRILPRDFLFKLTWWNGSSVFRASARESLACSRCCWSLMEPAGAWWSLLAHAKLRRTLKRVDIGGFCMVTGSWRTHRVRLSGRCSASVWAKTGAGRLLWTRIRVPGSPVRFGWSGSCCCHRQPRRLTVCWCSHWSATAGSAAVWMATWLTCGCWRSYSLCSCCSPWRW